MVDPLTKSGTLQERHCHRSLKFAMLVVMGKALQVSNQPFKWETPPGPSGSKESKKIIYVKSHMSIDCMVTRWVKVLHPQ